MVVTDVEDIVSRLYKILVSPDAIPGIINGALTVPLDLGYLALGYFDTDSRSRHQTHRYRMSYAIRDDVLNYENIKNAVDTILEEFDKYLTTNRQDAAYRVVITAIAGRIIMSGIAAKIAGVALARVSFISAGKGAKVINSITMILLLGGMSERSVRASERLCYEAPEIYDLLRPHNYDLTYFLIEPAVQPFVDAIHVRQTQGQKAFNEIIHRLGDKLNDA